MLLLVGLVTVGHPQHRKAEAGREMERPTVDIFPLDAVSSTFPTDVDVRLTNIYKQPSEQCAPRSPLEPKSEMNS